METQSSALSFPFAFALSLCTNHLSETLYIYFFRHVFLLHPSLYLVDEMMNETNTNGVDSKKMKKKNGKLKYS